ncbi:MAG TPA: hypothetical protein VG028_21620 [Terriglobia bacterium]|nr:hypothetical protein [Terriglobia bacterium]
MQIRKAVGRLLTIGLLISTAAISGFAQQVASAQSPSTGTTGAGDEVTTLKQQLAAQQKQIEALQAAFNAMKQKLDQTGSSSQSGSGQAGSVGEVASTTPVVPKGVGKSDLAGDTLAVAGPVGIPAASPLPKDADEASPLQLRVGSAYVTPVGFMDFTSVWRSHDGGSTIGTNFGGIPYGNVFQNNLSEFRLSMQNSRVGFRVDANVHDAHVIGYMESDFLGNNPGNVEVSSNSNTMRSRLYWVDVRKNNWEILGGQTWSLLTPGRSGISPLPGDIFFTQDMDVNYQAGLFWGRIPELRFVYHPSTKAALAFAIESPEQYVGGSAGGGLVTFPKALASTYAGELNVGSNTFGVPNVAPDFIAKLALDPSSRIHLEAGGIERNFKVWNPTTSTTYSAAGGGGFANANVELFKGFRLLTNNFISDGGGRYIFGQAPDLIAHADGSISLIHADSTVTGFEATQKNTLVFGYYGGIYIGRNVAIDATGTPVGYGFKGSGSGQNRAIQEGTFGLNQTIWKDAKWGALNFIGQYSYLTRNPWSVASSQPSNASLNMLFFDLRYTLPGSAPTLGK